jgi:hypothetical protein
MCQAFGPPVAEARARLTPDDPALVWRLARYLELCEVHAAMNRNEWATWVIEADGTRSFTCDSHLKSMFCEYLARSLPCQMSRLT